MGLLETCLLLTAIGTIGTFITNIWNIRKKK